MTPVSSLGMEDKTMPWGESGGRGRDSQNGAQKILKPGLSADPMPLTSMVVRLVACLFRPMEKTNSAPRHRPCAICRSHCLQYNEPAVGQGLHGRCLSSCVVLSGGCRFSALQPSSELSIEHRNSRVLQPVSLVTVPKNDLQEKPVHVRRRSKCDISRWNLPSFTRQLPR